MNPSTWPIEKKKFVWVVGALDEFVRLGLLTKLDAEDGRTFAMTCRGISLWDQIDADPENRPRDDEIAEILAALQPHTSALHRGVANVLLSRFRDDREEFYRVLDKLRIGG